MQYVMRKYRKQILLFIIIFVGVPMLFFGVPTAFDMSGGGGDRVIASIGDVELQESQFRQNFMGQNVEGLSPEMRQERARDVLDSMIDSALIEYEEKSRNFRVNESVLIEQMQQWEQFQNANGDFDPALWNQWVQAIDARGMNWKEIYDDLSAGLGRQVYMNTVLARADRMFEKELARKVEDEFTSYRIRYAQVEVEPDLSEDDLRQHYEDNLENYRAADSFIADFVAIPLLPPMPDEAPAIVAQARVEGADFAALADQHSNQGVQNGGDIGWQRKGPITMEHREPLFALAPGEVSDPVAGPNGYFIYKVEEERIDEETGEREVKARQIFLPSELSDDDRAAKEAEAEALKTAAAEGDLATAAAEAGFEVSETGAFDASSNQVDGLPRTDATQFASAFALPQEDDYRVITGRSNIYVARIKETIEGALPPYEDVASRVRNDASAAARRTEDYRAKVEAIAAELAQEASSLEALQAQRPDLIQDIQESQSFSGSDFFVQGVFIQSANLIDEIRDLPLGQMVGPIRNALQDTYFVELLEKNGPTEEDRAQFDEARERIRQNETARARFQMLDDYRKDLRERLLDSGRVAMTTNTRVLEEILAAVAPPAEAPEASEGLEGLIEVPATPAE